MKKLLLGVALLVATIANAQKGSILLVEMLDLIQKKLRC